MKYNEPSNVCISIIVYNKNYVDAFFEYPYLTIKNNIENLNNHKVTLYIETEETHYNYFKRKIEEIKHDNLKIEFSSKYINQQKNYFSYSFLTKIQIRHIIKAKKENFNYIFFTYGDMIYNNNCFINSINEIDNSNKISILTFALLLNKNNKFDIFMSHMLNNKNYLNYLLTNEELINPFHNLFSVFSFSYNKSFIYEINNENLNIKALHTHPVCLKLNHKTNINDLNKNMENVVSLDNGFLEYISNNEADYLIEEDLKKISIFTYDNFMKERFFINFNRFFDDNEKIIDAGNYIFFDYIYNKSSPIKKYLFSEFTMKISNSILKTIDKYNNLEDELLNKNYEIFMTFVKKSINDNKLIFMLRVLHPIHMSIIFFLVIMSKIPFLNKYKEKYQRYYFTKYQHLLTSTKKKDFLYHTCRRLFLINPIKFTKYFF